MPGAALKATSMLFSASTNAKPLASGWPPLAKGCVRATSRTTTLAFKLSDASGRMKSDIRTASIATSAIARDLCIDWDEIVFALELNSVAVQVNKRDGVGAGRCRLLQKIAKRAAQGVLIKITSAQNVKTRGLKSLRDQAGIICRGRKCFHLIGSITNHQCDTFFRLLRAC